MIDFINHKRVRFWFWHMLFVLGFFAAALSLPSMVWDPSSEQFFFVIGIIAIWRYSWSMINWVRFHIYNYIIFPKWRAEADKLGSDGMPSHIYLLVTSFRIGSETTLRVYKSVVAEAINYSNNYNLPVTILASIVERGDEAFIKQIFEAQFPSDLVRLSFIRIAGTGKRDALACGFRSISKMSPEYDAVAAVIDGDSMLDLGTLAKCLPMFKIHPDLGALTTDEACEVEGRPIFREWYSMRFAQRHIYMSSVSVSRRVLTLTGRMSMFRAEILCRPDFIKHVELDYIDHWRLGRFKFLTGDDKSSWYFLAKNGYPMLYIPDVQVITIETPPHNSFIKSSFVLMRRWFGNMLRTNGRVVILGPKPLGFFPWFSTLDQRMSMWTSLTGLMVALMASIAYGVEALLYYLVWIAFTRYVLMLSLLAARPSVSAAYPFLLYYNQIVGSLIKTYVLFRLDKQSWTRQKTSLKSSRGVYGEWLVKFSSIYMQAFAYALFLGALAVVSGILVAPNVPYWWHRIIG